MTEKAIPQRVGRLTLIEVRLTQLKRQRQTMVFARCDCGVATRIALHHWRAKRSTSCRDCAWREAMAKGAAALRAGDGSIR